MKCEKCGQEMLEYTVVYCPDCDRPQILEMLPRIIEKEEQEEPKRMKLTKKDADDVTEFFVKVLIYFLAIAMFQTGFAFAIRVLPSIWDLFPSALFAWGIALFEMGIRFIYRREKEEPEEKKGGGR